MRLLLLNLFLVGVLFGQSAGWQRAETKPQPVELFHSTHVITLPTAETINKSEFEFEISHRFIPPVNEGSEALWGIDGPVNMRLSLGYGLTDYTLLTVGRSNVVDNVDVVLKHKVYTKQGSLPLAVSVQLGYANNTQADQAENGNQFFGQLIFNTMLMKNIGIGVLPSYLNNAHIYCNDNHSTISLGSYVQYYISPYWNIVAEYVPTLDGWRQWHDSFSVGVELETGGHFFKIFATNNDRINLSQFLTGADLDIGKGDFRLGFMITRRLGLKK